MAALKQVILVFVNLDTIQTLVLLSFYINEFKHLLLLSRICAKA